MKVKAFLNRLAPFYLLSAAEATDNYAFDSYPVVVEQATLKNAQDLRAMITEMEEHWMNTGAPEDVAQSSADILERHLRAICKTRKQDNVRIKVDIDGKE